MNVDLRRVVKQLRGEREVLALRLAKIGEALTVLDPLVGKHRNNVIHMPRTRTISAAGRRRISIAQKARWARFKRARKVA